MEQIDRTERYLQRVRSFYRGVERPYHSINGFEDDVVSFFMHCHHISDWIAHLNNNGVTLSEVNKYIDKHVELQICADFCNGSKHYKLTRGTRSGHQPHMVVKNFESLDIASIDPIPKPSFEKASFKILANGETFDALLLAEKCFSLWLKFVKTYCA